MKPFPLLTALIAFLSLLSCSGNKVTFDGTNPIGKLGTPTKLAYYKNLKGQAFKYSDWADFVITDSAELATAVSEIKNADNPEPWKGAGWNRVIIYYATDTLKLFTNDKKIGTSGSGTFYDLEDDNFIVKNRK